MIIRTLSDDAYIERIRKNHAHHKPIALVAMVFGLLMVLGSLWAANHFQEQAQENLARLTKHTDIEPAVTEIALGIGMKIGSALASTALGGITILVAGINLLVGARRDRLLLGYHDDMVSRTQGSAAQQGAPADGSRAARANRG